MFSADSCGGWGVGLAARAAIQLGVDAVGVVILANSAVQAIQPHQESVPLPQPTVEVSGVPLQDQTPQTGWLTSFDAPPQQQVLADPLPTAEIGSNVIYDELSWRGENTTVVGQKSSGRLGGYTEGTSDLTGGLSTAEKLFQTMSGRALQSGDPNSLAPTDIFIDPGKLEVRFRPTSSSGTPVMEIIDHAAKTFEKIHFNQ